MDNSLFHIASRLSGLKTVLLKKYTVLICFPVKLVLVFIFVNFHIENCIGSVPRFFLMCWKLDVNEYSWPELTLCLRSMLDAPLIHIPFVRLLLI